MERVWWRRGVIMMAVVAVAGGVAWGEDRWTGGVGDFQWGSGGNWAGGVPGVGETAVFDGAGVGVVQLGGVTRTLGEVRLSGGGYTVAGGTLGVNRVTNAGGVNVIGANVTGSTLTLEAGGGVLDVSGVVSAGSLVVAGGGVVRLENGGNSVSGGVAVGDGASLEVHGAGSLGGAGVVLGEGASLAGYAGAFGNGVTVAESSATVAGYGGGTVSFGALNVGGAFVDYETGAGGTLAFGSARLSGDVTFATGGGGGVLRLGAVTEAGVSSSVSVAGGTVQLAGVGAYTGGTSVYGGATVEVQADGALGSGGVGVYRDGVLKVSAVQTAWPAVTVYSLGALVGDATNAKYSGVGRNVFLGGDAILAVTGGPVPVRGVDVNNAAYYLGVTSGAQVASVGEDGATSIYKGVAFGGGYSPGTFSGSVSEKVAGEGIEVYVAGGAKVTVHGAAFNTTNAGTGVHFFGGGEVVFDGVPGGSAAVYTLTGAGDGTSQGTRVVDLLAAGVVPAGRVLNVSDGVVYVGAAGAVGGTVNVKGGGTLLLSNRVGPTVNPSSGAYVIQAGGAVCLEGAGEHLGGGAAFVFQAGSLLGLGADTDTLAGAGWTTAGADVVVAGVGPVVVKGPGLVLGEGRRVTTGAYSDGVMSGGAITAAAGASVVALTAGTGDRLVVGNDVSLAGVDLFVGSKIPFTTLDGTYRRSVGQDGVVTLGGASNVVRDLTVAGGSFSFEGDRLVADRIDVGAGTAATLAAGVVTVGAVRVEGTLSVGAAKVTVGALSVAGAGRVDLGDRALVVDYAGESVAEGVRGLLRSGWDGGDWEGAGIVSSVAAGDGQGLSGIGYGEASRVLGLSGAAMGVWMGQVVDATSLLVEYTYYGDANLDGRVDGDDYALVDRGVAKGLGGWVNGDFNYDGVVDAADYLLMDRVWVREVGVLSAEMVAAREARFGEGYVAALEASVPEPGVAGLAGMVLVVGAVVRRRGRVWIPGREN